MKEEAKMGLSVREVPRHFAGRKALEQILVQYFSAEVRNVHTRRAYWSALRRFCRWMDDGGECSLEQIQSFHIARYVEDLTRTHSAPTAKQHLAALRMLFDYLVVHQVIRINPAAAVRGPRYSIRKGKTPILMGEETRELLETIDRSKLIGKRDRALIGVMVYAFARVGAALAMRVEDYFIQGRRGWVRLHEKGGKASSLPCHHHLDEMLEEYVQAGGLLANPKGWLFRPALNRAGLELAADDVLEQQEVHAMIRRRAKRAGIASKIGCHSFRATGITAYLSNGGRLELAQQMANHESPRTTSLYDRRGDEVSIDEVERIRLW